MRYLSVVLLILTGCEEQPPVVIDPPLLPYVQTFYNEAEMRDVNVRRDISVRIAPLEQYVLGRTQRRWNSITIIISDEYYALLKNKFPDGYISDLEYLMFHEFGHAALGRDHCLPCESIMHDHNSTIALMRTPESRQFLIDELFGESLE